MTTQPTTPNRWRPTFSIRSLVVLVTLACCYAACWGPTNRRGVADVAPQTDSYAVSAFIPLVIKTTEPRWDTKVGDEHDAYYFWFFGYVAKLPYERQITP